jgi:hypothetical protein
MQGSKKLYRRHNLYLRECHIIIGVNGDVPLEGNIR